MITSMKRLLLLFSVSGALAAADLAAAHTVYILSMSRGLDQYLANCLTNNHVLQVVTDPKLADVIFTDHLGDAFQAQLEKISPSPVEEAEAEAEAAGKDDQKDKADSSPGAFGPPVNKLDNPALASTFGRNKGTLFLVDAKSRTVLWSVYDRPKAYDSKTLDRTASEIVNRLKKDLGKK
jgi:hypothetical protein